MEHKCDVCGGPMSPRNARFCSRLCRNKYARSCQDQSGSNNPGWKGGIRDQGKYVAAYKARNPHKLRAWRAVQDAVRRGQLEKGGCENCGADEDIHGHHEDYRKMLDVRWLCRKCHFAEHY